MSKTTFLGYVPSLKSKHEATIVGHKAIESKGGSIRYTLQGEYQGRKTLPKTVSKADFEGIYGFDAKEAEAVIVSGSKDGEPIVRAHKVGQKEKDGFIPVAIAPIEKPQDDISEVAKEFYENHAESVLVVGRKDDGSQEVAGHVKGVADKEGFTPSKIQTYDDSIFDRQEIDVKSLKGNLVNHAETVVGNPSPASVEPPAPSDTPFPQEPSNENFSAEEPEIEYYDHVELEEIDGKLIVSLNTIQFFEGDAGDLLEDVQGNSNWVWTTADQLGGLSEADVLAKGGYGDDGDFEPAENVAYAYTDYQIKDWFQELKENGVVVFNEFPVEKSEVKEAFGFGKEDEEESEEPKTQEFTVVLQEGDKLELTDIEEEQPADDEPKEEDNDSNEEKDAESNQDIKWGDVKEMDNSKCPFCFRSAFRLIDEEGEEFSVYEEDIAGDNWLLECSRCKAEWNQDGENTLDGGYTGNAEYEAVSAKVTRPVKEDETEDDEESEGLSTLAKVGLGVGALAVGAAIFGAEGEYPQEFLDEFYDFDSNPTADTQDEETLAIAYAAWLESKRNEENIPYQAETDYTEIYGAFSIDKDDEGKIHIENKCDGCGKEFLLTQNSNIVGGNRAGAIVYENLDEYSSGHFVGDYPEYSPHGDLLCKSCYKEEVEEENYPYNRGQGQLTYDAEIFEARTTRKSIRHHPITDRPDYDTAGAKMITAPDGKDFSGKYERTPRNKTGRKRLSNPKKMGWDNANLSQDFTKTKKREKEDLRNIKKHGNAESFEAGNMMVKLQEVDGEAPYYNCPYCRNELTVLGGKGGIVAVCENESRCNGLEIPRQYLDDYEKYHWYVNERSSAENFSADFTKGYTDATETIQYEDKFGQPKKSIVQSMTGYAGDCPSCSNKINFPIGSSGLYCDDCEVYLLPSKETGLNKTLQYDAESKEAESKNLKMALGITAVGIGLAAVLGKEKIKTLFDRLGL